VPQEFLLKEYEFCFEQLRFYDKREESILKYTFSLVSAVATALFTVYKYFQDQHWQIPLEGFAAVLILLFLITLLLFFAAVSNRYYFVTTARQVNAIRLHFLQEADRAGPPDAFGIKKNRMWKDPDWPFLQISSLHTYIMVGLAVISSLMAAASVYVYTINSPSECHWTAVVPTFALALGIEIGVLFWRLPRKKQDNDGSSVPTGAGVGSPK